MEVRVGGCVDLDVVQEGGVSREVALENLSNFGTILLGVLAREPHDQLKGARKCNGRLDLLTRTREPEVGTKCSHLVSFVFRQPSPNLSSVVAILITDYHNKVANRQVLDIVNYLEAHSSARDSLSLTKAKY